MRVVQVIPPPPGATFKTTVPEDWEQLPVLHEMPLDSDPMAFMPLAAFMADAGSMIVSISSRPAHPAGSPSLWLTHLCRHLGFHPGPATALQDLNPNIVASCFASQATTRGVTPMRLVLFQDGGQWVLVTAMAVAWRWEAFEFDLLRLLGSLEILGNQGQSALGLDSIIPFPELTQERTGRPEPRQPQICEILRFAGI